jgi:hypothetical protein
MDSLLQEIRKIREAYAREFGYDLRAIHCDLKQQEQASGRRIVSLPPRRPKRTRPRGEECALHKDIQASAQGTER